MSYKQELKLNNQDLQEQINKVSSLSYDENLVLPLGIQSKLISLLQNSINEKTEGIISPISTFEMSRSANIQAGKLSLYNEENFFSVVLVPILVNDEITWQLYQNVGTMEIKNVVYNKLIIACGSGSLNQDSSYGINVLYNAFDPWNSQSGSSYCFLTLIGNNFSAINDGYIHFDSAGGGIGDL